jgi:diguanylate cyclase (GGDEF)-like protein
MDEEPIRIGAEIFVALINPAISLIFALAFVAMWLHQRRRSGLLIFAAAYSVAAAGFIVRYFGLPFGFEATGLVANALYVATAIMLAAGIVAPYERRLPLAALVGLAVAGYCAFSWFLLVQPSANGRIYAMNLALSGICFVIAYQLYRVPNRRPIDTALLAVAILAALSFVIRTAMVAANGQTPGDANGFFVSAFWVTLNFSWAVLSVLIGLGVLARAALDGLNDMQDQSDVDALTGLANRRSFEHMAAKLLADGPQPVALVLADLDGMAAVNDLYGRSAGDAVIAGFARLLVKAAGPDALCGRTGGDEFAVLLSGSAANSARSLAEGLRVRFGRTAAPGLPGGVSRVTASFGIATHAGESYGELQRRCDEAVFEAKRNGRDRVVMADAPPPRWIEPAPADRKVQTIADAWPSSARGGRRS